MPQVDRCRVPPAFWRAVEQTGIPPAALLRQARLPATLHLGGQTHITTAHYFALLQALEELSGDPALGIRMVQSVDTAVHPPSSLAAFYARDYRDGLARLARFKRLCTPELLEIAQAGGDCIITVDWPFATGPEPALSVDITFASLVELARPGPPSVVHTDYFGCPVETRSARDRLVLDAADLDRPFPGHNPELLALLTPALGAALGELDAGSSVAAQVRTVLKRSLASGQPGLAEVARQLGMSERTLQRRITAEGATFRGLMSEARRDLGRHLLLNPATDIDEVACLLGYQDTTSFYRAFRDWEGMPPSRWREMQRAQDGAEEASGPN